MKKLKIFLAVTFTGFVLALGILVWIGISIATSQTVQNQISNMKSAVQHIQLQPVGCWEKAQTLLELRPWIERPALQNIQELKVSCLETK